MMAPALNGSGLDVLLSVLLENEQKKRQAYRSESPSDKLPASSRDS
jgi:hypothetical protein